MRILGWRQGSGRTGTTGRGRRAAGLVASALLLGLHVPAVAAPSSSGEPVPSTAAAATGSPVLGHYGGHVVSGSSIDVRATVQALQQQGVTTYAYLVRTPQQWQDLPRFLRAAEPAGIDVWAYLVPPSSVPRPPGVQVPCWSSSYVNGGDYVSIFRSLGRLSAQLPALTAVVVDDFSQNAVPNPRAKCSYFTVDRVARMVAAARSHQPSLKFYPVLYHRDFSGASIDLAAFRAHVDGAVFPYRGETYQAGRWVPDYLRRDTQAEQVDLARRVTGRSKKLFVMHYAYHRCDAGSPGEWSPNVCWTAPSLLSSMVRRSLEMSAEGRADGVVVYRQPLADPADPRMRVLRALYARPW